MRVLAALAAAALTSLAVAQGGFSPETLMAMLAAQPAGRTTFSETRYSTALDVPLVTHGELAFERPARLERTVTAPVAERYVANGATVRIERAGTPPRTISLAQQPALAGLLESIRATLAGDLATLRRLYRVELGGEAREWSLVLLPRDPELAALVVSIRITGSGSALTEMEVREASGDRVATRFSGLAR